MKNFFFRAYKFGLRAQGAYGLLLSAMLSIGLVHGFPEGRSVTHEIAFLIVATLIGSVMGIPRFTPLWIADPNGKIKGAVIFVLSSLIIIFYCIVAIASVVPWQIQEPLSKSLAMLACVPVFLFSNVFGWSALMYGILPDKGQPKTPAKTEVPPPVEPTTSTDLRNLRHSRMSR